MGKQQHDQFDAEDFGYLMMKKNVVKWNANGRDPKAEKMYLKLCELSDKMKKDKDCNGYASGCFKRAVNKFYSLLYTAREIGARGKDEDAYVNVRALLSVIESMPKLRKGDPADTHKDETYFLVFMVLCFNGTIVKKEDLPAAFLERKSSVYSMHKGKLKGEFEDEGTQWIKLAKFEVKHLGGVTDEALKAMVDGTKKKKKQQLEAPARGSDDEEEDVYASKTKRAKTDGGKTRGYREVEVEEVELKTRKTKAELKSSEKTRDDSGKGFLRALEQRKVIERFKEIDDNNREIDDNDKEIDATGREDEATGREDEDNDKENDATGGEDQGTGGEDDDADKDKDREVGSDHVENVRTHLKDWIQCLRAALSGSFERLLNHKNMSEQLLANINKEIRECADVMMDNADPTVV